MGTKFIAEVGSNHNQDLKRALRFIDTAKEIGCWGVKFQYYHAEKLWLNKQRIEEARRGEINGSWLQKLRKHADNVGIEFGCSVYHPDNVKFVSQSAGFLKISSFENHNSLLYEMCVDTGLPLFISHGIMSNIKPDAKNLFCLSRYPADFKDCNLALLKRFDGWSDHTSEPAVIYSAVLRYGAKWVEFHLDLEDCRGNEFKYGHCWTPQDINDIIIDITIADMADGVDNEIESEKQREDLRELMWKYETDRR